MAITKTPNLGLQVPDFNTANWQVPMDYNLNLIDQLLSGNVTLSGFVLIEGIGFTPDAASDPDVSLSRLAAGSLAVGNGTEGDVSGILHAAQFVGSGENLTKTVTVQSAGAPVGQGSTLNFGGGLQATISGDTVTVLPVMAWQKFSLTMSGANWLVNGSVAGAKATSGAYQAVPLFTTQAKQTFHGLVIKPVTAFTGTLAGQCTMTVGSAANPDNLMIYAGDNYDLTAAVSSTNFYNSGGSKIIDFNAASIVANVFVNASSASALTGGAVDIYVLTSLLP